MLISEQRIGIVKSRRQQQTSYSDFEIPFNRDEIVDETLPRERNCSESFQCSALQNKREGGEFGETRDGKYDLSKIIKGVV